MRFSHRCGRGRLSAAAWLARWTNSRWWGAPNSWNSGTCWRPSGTRAGGPAGRSTCWTSIRHRRRARPSRRSATRSRTGNSHSGSRSRWCWGWRNRSKAPCSSTSTAWAGESIGFEGGTARGPPSSVEAHEDAVWILIEALGLLDAGSTPGSVERRGRLARHAEGLPRVLDVRCRHAVSEEDGFRMHSGFHELRPHQGRPRRSAWTGRVRFGRCGAGRILLPLYQRAGGRRVLHRAAAGPGMAGPFPVPAPHGCGPGSRPGSRASGRTRSGATPSWWRAGRVTASWSGSSTSSGSRAGAAAGSWCGASRGPGAKPESDLHG